MSCVWPAENQLDCVKARGVLSGIPYVRIAPVCKGRIVALSPVTFPWEGALWLHETMMCLYGRACEWLIG